MARSKRSLSGRVEDVRSRRGSLKRRLLPSILILRVTRVSRFVGIEDAMTAQLEAFWELRETSGCRENGVVGEQVLRCEDLEL
jgi:hypothetical protein